MRVLSPVPTVYAVQIVGLLTSILDEQEEAVGALASRDGGGDGTEGMDGPAEPSQATSAVARARAAVAAASGRDAGDGPVAMEATMAPPVAAFTPDLVPAALRAGHIFQVR